MTKPVPEFSDDPELEAALQRQARPVLLPGGFSSPYPGIILDFQGRPLFQVEYTLEEVQHAREAFAREKEAWMREDNAQLEKIRREKVALARERDALTWMLAAYPHRERATPPAPGSTSQRAPNRARRKQQQEAVPLADLSQERLVTPQEAAHGGGQPAQESNGHYNTDRAPLELHPGLWKIEEAAEYLHIKDRKVHYLVAEGELHPVKIGRGLFFEKNDLDACIKRHRR